MAPYVATPFWNAREARPRALWRLLFFVAIAAVVANPLILLLDITDHRLLEGSFENALIACGFFVALAATARWMDRRPLHDFGFVRDKGWWGDLGIGFAIGGGIAAFVFGVHCVAGWVSVRELAWSAFGVPFAVAFGGQVLRYAGGALFEELVTRSYLLRMIAEFAAGVGMSRRGGLLLAWLATSAVFGALHLGNPGIGPGALGNLAMLGLLFGLPMVLTGSLAASIGMHMGWNVVVNNVFGLPNGGQQTVTSVLLTSVSGPTRWTGGAFGPEGGLLILPAVAVGVGLVLVWQRRRGAVRLDLSLADAPATASPTARRMSSQ
jgi:hypothetical protein